jgi:hypothetical protein
MNPGAPGEQDLKKQSQFGPTQIGAKSFAGEDYESRRAGGLRENKVNQSQFPGLELFREKNLLLKFRGYFRYIFDGSY